MITINKANKFQMVDMMRSRRMREMGEITEKSSILLWLHYIKFLINKVPIYINLSIIAVKVS